MVDNNSKNRLEAYDAIAPFYEKYSEGKQSYLDAVDQLVIENIKIDDRLLDIGAGDGRRLYKIKKEVGLEDVIAIEPSCKMAKICREKVNVPVYEVFAENINELEIGKFDVVTALWNVFGHIPNSDARVRSLKNIASKLKSNSIVILDVNNRHNALGYGKIRVLVRTFIDWIYFKESRGDAVYDWKIEGQIFKSRGHLFTPREIEDLFTKSGLRVKKRFSLNYATGEISESKYKGQLFYILSLD